MANDPEVEVVFSDHPTPLGTYAFSRVPCVGEFIQLPGRELRVSQIIWRPGSLPRVVTQWGTP